MDPNWLNALVALVTLLVVLTSIAIRNHFKLSKELSDYKTHVAESYSKKDEVTELGKRLEQQMQKGFDRLYETLNNKRDAA